MSKEITSFNLYNGLKPITDLTGKKLYRGMTDFSDASQFQNYTSGHPRLLVVDYPKFIDDILSGNCKGGKNDDINTLISNAIYIMEREFKGIDGLEDITSETAESNDGFNTINMINKVIRQSASTLSMRFNEKSGQPMTKFAEFYLRGIYDPDTHFKHYHGADCITDPGFDKEIFTMLYYTTDTTGLNIESAYFIFAAQLNKAELNINNSTKGEHDVKEITYEFNCVPVRHRQATLMAQKHMDAVGTIKNYNDYNNLYKYPTDNGLDAAAGLRPDKK